MQTHHWLGLAIVIVVVYILGNMMIVGNWASKVGMG